MPRVTIYVPDGLHQELMAKPGVNVSAVCQAALANHLRDMKTGSARLARDLQEVADLNMLLRVAAALDAPTDGIRANLAPAYEGPTFTLTPDGED